MPADSPDKVEILADLYELILSWSEPPAAGEEPAGPALQDDDNQPAGASQFRGLA